MIGRTECWSSPLQFKLKSNVQCDGILRWGLWEVSRSWGWSPREEIIALIKEVRELVSYLSAMCREQVRMSPSNDINYLVKLWQNVCVLYSGTWWHFVFLCHGRSSAVWKPGSKMAALPYVYWSSQLLLPLKEQEVFLVPNMEGKLDTTVLLESQYVSSTVSLEEKSPSYHTKKTSS